MEEKIITIELTERQLAILQEFMGRVELKGKEVPSFAEIHNKLFVRGGELSGK